MALRKRQRLALRGAVYTPSEAGRAGAARQVVQQIEQGRQERTRSQNRRDLLAKALASGKLSTSDLSRSDAELLGGEVAAINKMGIEAKVKKPASGVSGFFENLLGEKGLEGVVTHLPQGLYAMGKGVVEDITSTKGGKIGALAGAPLMLPGIAIGGAAGALIGEGEKSETYKNIVKPTADQYAYMYGGKGAPKGMGFWERFYDQPLGPLLDIGTLASLGVGSAARGGGLIAKGARAAARPTGETIGTPSQFAHGGLSGLDVLEPGPIAARVERFGNRLASMTASEGRRPARASELDPRAVDIFAREKGADISVPEVPTLYSNRPFMKLGQKSFDILAGSKLGRKPVMGHSLEGLRNVFMSNKFQNRQRAAMGLETQLKVQEAIEPFVKLGNKLTPLEQQAWWLAAQGITGRTKLLQAADFWEKSRAGTLEWGANAGQLGIKPEYIDALAELARGGEATDKLVTLLENPTPGMIKLDQEWGSFLEDAQTRLVDPETGEPLIDPAEAERRQWMVRKTLSQADNLEGARRAFETWRYTEGMMKIKQIDSSLNLGGLDEAGQAAVRDYGYPIAPKYVPHVPATELEYGARRSLTQRITRADVEPELYHGPRRRGGVPGEATRSLQEPFQAYLKESDEQLFRAGALRMDIQSLITTASTMTRDLVFKDFNPAELARVAIMDEATGAPRLFKNQTEVNYSTGKTTKDYVWVPKAMQKYYEGHVDALAILASGLRELEAKGVKFQHVDAEGMEQILEPLRAHAETFSKDFVGTSEATGYAVPRSYLDKAMQHAKAAEGPTSTAGKRWSSLMNTWRTWTLALMPRWWINTAVGSFFMATMHGTWDAKTFWTAQKLMRNKATNPLQTAFKEYAAQVRLGGVAGAERLEAGGALRARSHGLYSMVQGIEDFFRTAAFVKQLKREERHSMDEVGSVLETFTPFRFWGEEGETRLAGLMSDPVLVDAAVDEVNRFFYNYLQLGPTERFYVRQFIPFWGWYKFITKFVWRLPVAYPGRANVVAHLGMVGQELEEQLGVLPDYLKGSIFLNKDLKKLKFMSTFGLNPMSQFANPYSIRGGLPGMVNLGQINPVGQAALQGFGISPLGGETSIGPEAGIGMGLFGQPIDVYGGREVDLQQKASFSRFLGSLMRSIPQTRIGETAISPEGVVPTPIGGVRLPFIEGTGGRPAYPESIPFVREFPMPVRAESRKDVSSIPGMLGAYTGLAPKQRNQARYIDWIINTQIPIAKANLKKQRQKSRQR